MTQLRAIEILLRKCLPDLAAAESKSEQTHRYVVEMPLYWTGMNGSGDVRAVMSSITSSKTIVSVF
jgi:hypothetical protein